MKTERFDKKLFKQEVLNNLKTQFRVELNNASQQQIYQAVAYALKEWIIEDWMDTQKTYEEKDPKILYYMSMEFLMGRALGNNLINMSMYGEVKEALDELGVDLNAVEDQEPDPALVMVVLEYWQHVSLIHWQHLDMQPMDVESAINTECSNRRSKTDIR